MLSKFTSYLPKEFRAKITYQKVLDGFPTNVEMAEAGIDFKNTATIKTRLKAEDEKYFNELNDLEVPDPERPGQMKKKYDGFTAGNQFFLDRGLLDWSFTDSETGEKWPFTLEALMQMEKADFDYLIVAFYEATGMNKAVTPASTSTGSGTPGQIDQTIPKAQVTEDEKKSSSQVLSDVGQSIGDTVTQFEQPQPVESLPSVAG